jgi:hypothetical protein
MPEALSPREANSRFRYVEPPFPLPGKCAVCGNVKRPAVDFGASIDPYGAVLICIACVAESYEVLVREGLVEVPQAFDVEKLRIEVDRLRDDFGRNLASMSNIFDAYSGVLSSSYGYLADSEHQDTIGPPKDSVKESTGSNKSTDNIAGSKGSVSVPSNHSGGTVFGNI